MKKFIRSLRYLKPYRVRIGVAVVCVLCIAMLWGSGLGLILPAAKVLLSDEGLHGWAWNTLCEDRLGARVVQQIAPPDMRLPDGRPITLVVNVVDASKNGPARSAGIKSGYWLVGEKNGQGEVEVVRGDVLADRIAHTPEGATREVALFNPNTKTVKMAAVTMGKAQLTSDLLGKAADFIPAPKDFAGRFPIFVGVLLLGLFTQIFRALFTYIQEYLVGTAIWQGIMDMRQDNYNVVLHLPTTFFSEKGVSDATSRFIQDTNELARGQNTLFGKTMVEPAKLVGSMVLAVWLEPKMTLLAMLVGPPAYLLIRLIGKRMHKASKRALESWSEMLEVLGETLQGIRVVKAYTMEGQERKRFFQVNRRLLKQQNKMERLDAATGPAVETLGMVGGLAAAGLAGYMVFHGNMDRYVFITWLGTLFALFDPVRKMAKVSNKFQQAEAAAVRIFELQDTAQETFVHGAPALPRHAQSIEFDNVTFGYPGSHEPVLRDIRFTVQAGQKVAIVGPNGSGKTTLVSLLPRLLDPTAGVIRIDGQDVSQCSVRSLRSQIGLVTQDAVLFHATIGENIAYGKRRTKPEQIVEVAKKAFVDEFVRTLPNGYDTMVGEHGTTLSGGQKQRIAIARAMLRDPAILIFDEAMSQVDADSERRIQQSMDEFSRGRTTLLIAHRFATVLAADRIVVLGNGRIVDTGTHKELLDRCELYRHLYKTQFADTTGE